MTHSLVKQINVPWLRNFRRHLNARRQQELYRF